MWTHAEGMMGASFSRRAPPSGSGISSSGFSQKTNDLTSFKYHDSTCMDEATARNHSLLPSSKSQLCM